jgi:hypothetical protein
VVLGPPRLDQPRDGRRRVAGEARARQLLGEAEAGRVHLGGPGAVLRLPGAHAAQQRVGRRAGLGRPRDQHGVEGRPHVGGEGLGLQRRAGELPAGEQLEEGDAQRVDVDLLAALVGEELLGRHVPRGAKLHRLGPPLAVEVAPRDAEVEHLHAAVARDQDVGGLDVPVHHGQRAAGAGLRRLAGEAQGAGHGLADLDRSPRRQRGVPEQRAAVDAVDDLHQQGWSAVDLHHVDDLDDVVVVQQGEQPGLVAVAGGDVARRRQLGGEDLHREALHKAAPRVHLGEVDRAKAAGADGLQEPDGAWRAHSAPPGCAPAGRAPVGSARTAGIFTEARPPSPRR